MPEGAYEASYADLHYGQSYDDAAELYNYVCPMAYSTNYGKSDDWVVTLAKNSIAKGNGVVMGIQVFDSATSARIMAEMENIRALMKDPTYGGGMLGTVFFRSGTFDYAKATYDSAQKIITVKLENTGTSAYTQVRIEAKNGIKITDASIGDGINAKASVTVSSSGTSATLKNSNLLGAGKEGYRSRKAPGAHPHQHLKWRKARIHGILRYECRQRGNRRARFYRARSRNHGSGNNHARNDSCSRDRADRTNRARSG